MKRSHFFPLLLMIVLGASCSNSRKLAQHKTLPDVEISSVRFLGQYIIPHNLPFGNTNVGGLSSIDYDPANDIYYIICDSRSVLTPAHFYTAKIFFNEKGIDSVKFLSVHNLLQADGNGYPSTKDNPSKAADPEAMRYDAVNKQLVWGNEGERIVKSSDTVLQDASINIISTTGAYIGQYKLPENMRMHASEKGTRENSVFEGMTFSADNKDLYVSVEEPLYEDGPKAEVTDNDPFVRLLRFDTKTKLNTAQYAYKLAPVKNEAIPPTAFKINGITDILSLGNNKFIVLERAYSVGNIGFPIKIFIADLSDATNIIDNPSLITNKDFKPATKKLLLNMDDLNIYTDNVEGVTLGPLLPNGHRSLILIADNNFNKDEKSQVFLFEVIP